MEFPPRFTARNAVSQIGAHAGCVLGGSARNNKGLRLKISQAQPKGHGGPIVGTFQILDVGENKYSTILEGLLGRPTDAHEILRVLRLAHPQCVNVVNANVLVAEQG